MKILTVDDNRDNLELLRQILVDEAHDVTAALGGAECVQMALEEPPDLIMLDVQMPGMDGYETFQKLQENERTKEIPVIFLSARYKDIDRIVKGLEMGAFDYLTKPIDDEILLAKVRVVGRIIQAENEVKQQKIELEEINRQLKKSLDEKEILMKEIHHRVKNNLQVMISLLNLQRQNIDHERYKKMFDDALTRIKTMTLLHEQLYQGEDSTQINLFDYIKSLIGDLSQIYIDARDRISLNLDGPAIALSFASAINCGLIINELVTNAMKYAFPEDVAGSIRVALRERDKGEIEVIVADNGVGLPENIDFRNSATLGLQIIVALAEHQLKGEISLERKQGTEFRIRFNNPIGRT